MSLTNSLPCFLSLALRYNCRECQAINAIIFYTNGHECPRMTIKSVHDHFMGCYDNLCNLELDAEFEGKAVVGVVLEVHVVRLVVYMLDHVFVIVKDYNICALKTVA